MEYKVQITDEAGNVQQYVITRSSSSEDKSLNDLILEALRISGSGLPKCRISETSDLSRNFLAAFWQTAVMRMCRLV